MLILLLYLGMISLAAEARTVTGKKTKDLRKTGKVPAILYGFREKNQTLAVSRVGLEKAWRAAGESSLVALAIEGDGVKNVLIHEIALDPLHDHPLHVDFYAVRMDKSIEASIPLKFVGESEAVKASGGILVKVIHEVEVLALPKDLVHEIEVDISKLATFESRIIVADIALPKGVTAKTDPESVVALVEPPRSEAELAALETKEEASLEGIEVVGKKEKTEEETAEEVEKSSE